MSQPEARAVRRRLTKPPGTSQAMAKPLGPLTDVQARRKIAQEKWHRRFP